ncbi:hypothetical protein Desaci_0616 [Desulfosporosinus acidiphilus SJ4]|uniref:Uncharacterized protein n=1 Tax=Desulfosporosinus acidiphilus (strain DSM 22704 / JCM 16185 / SJ4) TaxID=646529 RepID=I4D1K4_DESAJ|nr:hypothetical protein [Desulfosporosinus acidiphilus]AFM39678.1 hypothetical protein Desaci_0616 [Desulfosporosinus acidiphilus SJ4]
MPYFTTGLINNSWNGVGKKTVSLNVEISNEDTSTVAVQIDGYFYKGQQKFKYVDEFFVISSGTVDQRNFNSIYDDFEFQVFVSSYDTHVSIRRVEANGKATPVLPMISSELHPI